METSAPSTGRKATRREWIGLAVIALPCLVYSMDLTVLNLAIPTLAAELKPSAGQLLWIIDIYGFMVAGFLMTMGTLGDRIGRRRLLLYGAAAFGVASALAAFASTAEELILMRALLGIAGATLAPSTLSLITVMFTDERERSFAISMWVASFSAGGILGPLIGGVLIEWFHWGSVFLIAVPVMVLLLACGPWLLPEYKAPRAGRIDLASALLSLGAVLGVIYGIKHGSEYGWGPQAIGALTGGFVLAAVFVRRQGRLADPMIDLALFARPAFSASLAINLGGVLFMFGSFIFVAQYFQLVAGLSPLQAALASLPSALAFTVASFLTPPLAARFRPVTLMTGGMALAAVGFFWLALAPKFELALEQIVAATVLFSIGFTPVITLTTGLIVGSAPPERAGAASAMSETAVELGGALGIAFLGSLGAALYRAGMQGVAVAGVPAEGVAAMKSTLGGALGVAAALRADQAAMLVDRARDAFMDGFVAVAWLSIAGMVVAAAVALSLLREVKPVGH
jgi:DHA2 family multidrug resistance protein-like MFS transporter